MKLKYVTLTGADDTVSPAKLAALSTKYPFVEWAILFSQSKSGVARYPSLQWVEDLMKLANDGHILNLSAHLCGKWVDDAIKGEITFFRDVDYKVHFQRVQLNMGKDRLKLAINCKPLLAAIADVRQEVIFGGNYQYINSNFDHFPAHRICPMYDASGGRGVLTRNWPAPAVTSTGEEIFCGYAGGLGPDNIADELKNIAAVVGDRQIWVDMETKVRTKGQGDIFDLEKCEQVLQAAAPWVG